MVHKLLAAGVDLNSNLADGVCDADKLNLKELKHKFNQAGIAVREG